MSDCWPLSRVQATVLPSVEPRSRIDRLNLDDELQRPVWHPLAADLGLVYVFETDRTRVTVRHSDLVQWGISPRVIRLVAGENLRTHRLERHRKLLSSNGPLLLFHHQDLPVAACLDCAAFRAELRQQLRDVPIVTIPRRNTLLATPASISRTTLQDQARRLYRTATYPLSDKLIRVDGANLQIEGAELEVPAVQVSERHRSSPRL